MSPSAEHRRRAQRSVAVYGYRVRPWLTMVPTVCVLLTACAGDPDVVGSLLTEAPMEPIDDPMDAGDVQDAPEDAGLPFFDWRRDAAPPPMEDPPTGGSTPPPPPPPCNFSPNWLQVARDTCTIPASLFTSGEVSLFEVLSIWGYLISQRGTFSPSEDCGFGNIFGIRIDSTTGDWHFCEGPPCDALKEYAEMRNIAACHESNMP